MKINDKTINAWQVGILIFILTFANKILTLPSLLYDKTGVEGFLVPVFLFGFEIGLLVLFCVLKNKYPNASFAEILNENLGRVMTKIVFALMMVFFLAKTVLLYNVTYIFFRNLIYKDVDNFLFLICFLPVVNHLAISGLRVVGRTAQMFFPTIVVIVLFCIIVGVLGIGDMPMLFQTNAPIFFKSSFTHMSAFGDMMFLFAIMDKVKMKKGQWKIVFSFAGVAMLCVVAITTIFIFSYTYTAFMHPYALFEIMSYVKEYGGIGRIDIISMVLIVIFTYFHLAIYLKVFMLSFDVVFNKIGYIYSVLSFNFLFLIGISFLVSNLQTAVVFGEGVLPYFSIIPFVVVPIFSLVAMLVDVQRRKKRDKKELKT